MDAGIYYFAESERTYEGMFANNLFEGKGKTLKLDSTKNQCSQELPALAEVSYSAKEYTVPVSDLGS